MARSLQCCWRHLQPKGQIPLPRSSHTVSASKNRVCVFGGEDIPRNAFDPHVYILDSTLQWTRADAPAPSGPLLGHSAASVDNMLYIFGGRTGGPNDFGGAGASGETGDLLVFDVDKGDWDWHRPASGWPEPRSFQAMSSSTDGGVYMFGGCGASGRLNDLWRLNHSDRSWTCLHAGGLGDDIPKPRGGACIVAGKNRLVLLFGFDGTQRGEIAVFDLAKNAWDILPQEAQSGDVPAPRSVFCTAQVGDGAAASRAFVFGGERVESALGHEGAGAFVDDLYSLDVETLVWSKHVLSSKGPSARGWAGMASPDPDTLVLFGGLDASNTRLGDMWQLDIASE